MKQKHCIYFTLGYAACLLTAVIVLILVSVGRGERGSGRGRVEQLAQASAQTQTNPPKAPDKGSGRRD